MLAVSGTDRPRSSCALLHMLHLSSPALPIGAYAYSQGLEYAIDSGVLATPVDIKDWINGMLLNAMAHLDLPIFVRCYRAWSEGDHGQCNEWNNFLRASRETSELLLEDEQLGAALQRLIADLELPSEPLAELEEKPCFVLAFTYAAQHWGIELADALSSFSYSWLENQVAAATKIVPLGQTAAQKILLEIIQIIPSAIDTALILDDDDIGMSLPGQVMASSQHEYQYSRLFRS